MDFMKVLDQTVRDIKREVNLKVLKVPEMEQKVLDATSNEPWGPHGSTLAEIAQATKKFTECQMIMNVLWTRLADTGPSWRHVYKALAVIEYLVANGSERAVDDILEHTFQISSISGFKYVEPNGKDVGNNVRKKVETILALLDDKEKIQAVRDKAAANRDKFFGLSSTGITYNSRSALHDTSSYHDNDRYGGLSGAKEGESFKDSYKDRVHYGGETDSNHGNKDGHNKSQESLANENERNKSVKGTTRRTRDQGSLPSSSSKPLTKPGPVPSAKSSSVHPTDSGDDFDDFDPRGSSNGGSAATSYNQVDLFGQSLLGDLMDAPTSIPPETGTLNSDVTPEVDLFADATFISASPQAEGTGGSHAQGNVDLFASQPAFPAGIPSDVVDFFTASGSGLPAEAESTKSEHTNINSFDSFAAVQLENSEGSDLFGAFTSHSDPVAVEPSENYTNNSLNNLDQTSSKASKPAPKDTFQVKSGIWADSLSRGLIDLNITASKKTSLVDIGIVGGLGDGYDDKGRGGGPATSAQVGRAIGAGSGLGRSGFTSSTVGGNGSFSTLGQQQFGSFK